MTSLFQILLLIIGIVKFIIIAHVIMSWLINFQILNLRQPLVASIWDGLNRLLEPVYSRIRSFLPQMGGLDLAPLIAFVAVIAIEIVLRNNAMAFY
ncbi:MAG: YggT family protein [Sagittula sp.]|jgi:YggT family protein|uniref:YggT family protein n=1 Tax=unclassified Sagittula TaxID=2624628 RepID=UPI000C2D2413|nr:MULTISPECIES: YggT family protein [unclassified Sagittula]AUC53461.1 YggT family protein [Sagittula sp. P11]WHZ35074.1 YggT family protein [Sagittula sp. MA-2]